MEVVSIIARLLLAGVFAIAGVAKLADRAGSIRSMRDFGLPQALAKPAATLLPVVELVCAIALITPSSARWGAIGVLLMLAVFVVAIAISLARGRTPNCHCFGQLHSEPVGWTTLVRNLALAAIAGLVIWHNSEVTNASDAQSVLNATGTGSTAIVTAAIGAGMAALALMLAVQLLRQNGRLLLRLEAIEAKLGVTAGADASGLPVDSAAPEFSLRDLDGQTVTLASLGAAGKPILLVFTEPGCSACDVLLPEVGRWQREYADRLTTAVISRGTIGQNTNKRAKHFLHRVLIQSDEEVATAYRVVGTPSAVVVAHGKVTQPIAAGADAIRDLLTDLVAVRARKGDPTPSLVLEDLHRNSRDLSLPHGRRTLLLFWNPGCGFCQQMLDDMKAWEVRASAAAPELLVISTGSAAANEQQGFQSRVFLDPEFRVGQVLGASGTPSAVLLNENGSVASDVAVGKNAILTLANS